MTHTPSPLAPTTLVERLRGHLDHGIGSDDIEEAAATIERLSASPAPQAVPASVEALREALTFIRDRADKGGRRMETAMLACDQIEAAAAEALASAQRVDAPLAANPAQVVTTDEQEGLRKWREDQLDRVRDGSFLTAAIGAGGQAVDAPAVKAQPVAEAGRELAEKFWGVRLEPLTSPAPSQRGKVACVECGALFPYGHTEAEIERLTKERDAIGSAIGTVRFMDPPDGGDVPLSEQVRRMHSALAAAESRAADLSAALEPFAKAVEPDATCLSGWRIGVTPKPEDFYRAHSLLNGGKAK